MCQITDDFISRHTSPAHDKQVYNKRTKPPPPSPQPSLSHSSSFQVGGDVGERASQKNEEVEEVKTNKRVRFQTCIYYSLGFQTMYMYSIPSTNLLGPSEGLFFSLPQLPSQASSSQASSSQANIRRYRRI